MPLSITFVIQQIWKILNEHMSDFKAFGGIIVGFLFAIEMLDEAMDLVAGRGFQLDKKLILYLLIATIIIGYAPIGNALWDSAIKIGNEIVKNYDQIKTTSDKALKDAQDMSSLNAPGILKIVKAILYLPKALLFGFATILISISLIILVIMIGGAYACLGFIIISGPLFIAFMLSPHTRGLFMNWLQNLISYFILIPFLGWTMQISFNIYISCYTQFENSTNNGIPEISSILILMIGPILAIGISLQVPKIVSTLTGGAVSAGMAGVSAAGAAIGGASMHGGHGGSGGGSPGVGGSGSGGSGGGAGLIGGVTGKK